MAKGRGGAGRESAPTGVAGAARRGEVLRSVAPASLAPSPWQPRLGIATDDAFAALVDSVRSRGVLEPLLAREAVGGVLELLAGQRRLEASKAAGLDAVPVRVLRGLTDTDAREVALVENLARADLTAWEEARALAALRDALAAAGKGSSARHLEKIAGRSKSAVARALQIADRLTPVVLTTAAVPNWDRLPARVLEAAARGESESERVRLLRREAKAYAQNPAGESRKRRRLTSPGDRPLVTSRPLEHGGWRFEIGKPIAQLDHAEAKVAISALDAVIKALLARLRDRP